ncbi:MAG: hypothetical protein ACLFP8_09345 [Alphaproteobacteria bacterium]
MTIYTISMTEPKECEWRFNEGTPTQLLDDLKNILKEKYQVSAYDKSVYYVSGCSLWLIVMALFYTT